MTGLLWALPWVAAFLFVRFATRFPSELPGATAELRESASTTPAAAAAAVAPASETVDPGSAPLVSIVVPARNERLDIAACVASLVATEYPRFEVIVVDDRSEDDTGTLARGVGAGRAERFLVLEGAPVPDGWLGKPWACHQGAREARGDLLLFTDADTTHGPGLLGRAVTGLREDEADLLTVVGRQLMGSFWERLVLPHVFLVMLFRFPSFERTVRSSRWRDAIANGQYLLFRREAYERIGGHEGVRDEVVEDLALAQRVKRAGLALRLRGAEGDLETRMYRSFRDLVEGWTKNLFVGGAQSFSPAVRPLLVPAALVTLIAAWLAPAAVLVVTSMTPFASAAGATGVVTTGPGSPVWSWAAASVAASVATHGWFSGRMGAGAVYGLLYPLGVAVTVYILVRSWLRGRNVEWKGRRYVLPPLSERP